MMSYFTSYMLFAFVLMPCIYTKIFKNAYLSNHNNAIYLSNTFLSYDSGFWHIISIQSVFDLRES